MLQRRSHQTTQTPTQFLLCFAQAANPCWAQDHITRAPPIQVLINYFPQENIVNPHEAHLSLPPGGGATLRGSDGQLHPRAPPKPLRVSTVFSNTSPVLSTDPDEDPSSYYSELIIRVKTINYFIPSSKSSTESIRPVVVFRSLSLRGRAMWTGCVRRRSGRAELASQRLPLGSWRPRTTACPHSCCFRKSSRGKQQRKRETGILNDRMFV